MFRIITIGVISFIMFASELLAFPLRKANVGDKFDYNKVESVFNEYSKFISLNNKKAIIIWRYSKLNSKKIFVDFYRVCRERSIVCISFELDGVDAKEILNLIKVDRTENLVIVKDKGDIIGEYGIFTLPVTIFLDEKNSILDAVGFEGQFYDKMSRYIDFITGKISKEEYEKQESSEVLDRRVSLLPKINFINKLLESSKKDEAIRELENLKLDGASDLEYIKVAELYMRLEDYKKAEELISHTNPNDVSSRYYKAFLFYKTQRFKESLEILKTIENIYPNKKALFSLMGKVYLKMGDFKNAAEYYDKTVDF